MHKKKYDFKWYETVQIVCNAILIQIKYIFFYTPKCLVVLVQGMHLDLFRLKFSTSICSRNIIIIIIIIIIIKCQSPFITGWGFVSPDAVFTRSCRLYIMLSYSPPDN